MKTDKDNQLSTQKSQLSEAHDKAEQASEDLEKSNSEFKAYKRKTKLEDAIKQETYLKTSAVLAKKDKEIELLRQENQSISQKLNDLRKELNNVKQRAEETHRKSSVAILNERRSVMKKMLRTSILQKVQEEVSKEQEDEPEEGVCTGKVIKRRVILGNKRFLDPKIL